MMPMHRQAWLPAVFVACMAFVEVAASAMLTAGGVNQLGFAAMQMDVRVEGKFGAYTAEIDFDPARPESGKVNLGIDLATVNTGSTAADTLIKGMDFFDVAHFPRATFASSHITQMGPGRYQALGRFTLKGHSADLAVPFVVHSDADGMWLEGSVPISRLAYKVGLGEWSDTGTLADQVQVRFRLHLPR